MKRQVAAFYETEKGRNFLKEVCAACPFEKDASVVVVGFGEPYRACWDIITCPLADCLDFLPYRSQSFKYVLVVHALEYVPDPSFLLKEVKRIAAPGAEIVCITPTVQNQELPTQSLFTPAQIRQEVKAQNLIVERQKKITAGKTWKIFSLSDGCFTATIARKEEFVPVLVGKTYKARRMTKASIFSSPRT